MAYDKEVTAGLGETGQVTEQQGLAHTAAAKIAEVNALVLAVRLTVRVLHAGQQQSGTRVGVGERANERQRTSSMPRTATAG